MRVTNSMISNQVVFNMQRSLRTMLTYQNQMSSGRRINKASDDPLGTVRDLDYRTELSRISQYRSNLSQGMNWLTTYDTLLSDVNDQLVEAKVLAENMANENGDELLSTMATEVRSIIDQIASLSKSELEGRRVFSGYRTRTDALRISTHGAVYQGDDGAITYQVESSVREKVNLSGAEVFLKQVTVLGEESDLNVGLTLDTLLENLNGGDGIDMATGSFVISDVNMGVSSTITLSGETTVDEVITTINNQLVADGITNLTVDLSDDGNNLRLTPVNTGLVTASTPLDSINGGSGLDSLATSFRVTDGAGIDIEVDISSASTLGEVITTFNNTLFANGVVGVAMTFNAAGTGLSIVDFNGVPLGLSVENVDSSNLAADQLGIAGFVGNQLVGQDLNPASRFEITENGGSTAYDLGILDSFTTVYRGLDLDPQLTVDSLMTDLNNRIGAESGEIVIWQGDQRLSFSPTDTAFVTVQDLLDFINTSHLNVTAEINEAGTGIQISNNDPYRSLTIQDDGGRAARDMGLFGGADMIGTLLALEDALHNNDQEAVGLLLQQFDNAITHAIDLRAQVGSKTVKLEATDSRLVDLNINFTALLSEVEDADITEVYTDLATFEANYQAALASAARIIQPTLMNFLY